MQQLKSRTECRKCGQKGHWSGDAQCPKSRMDNKGKGSKTPSTASTGAGSSKHHGKGKGHSSQNQKSRVVYFAMHQDGVQDDFKSYMAVHGRASASSEPQSMPTSHGMPRSEAMPSFLTMESASPELGSAAQSLLAQGWSADQVLEFLIRSPQQVRELADAERSSLPVQPAGRPESFVPEPQLFGWTLPDELHGLIPSEPQHPSIMDGVLGTLADMEVEENIPSMPVPMRLNQSRL